MAGTRVGLESPVAVEVPLELGERAALWSSRWSKVTSRPTSARVRQHDQAGRRLRGRAHRPRVAEVAVFPASSTARTCHVWEPSESGAAGVVVHVLEHSDGETVRERCRRSGGRSGRCRRTALRRRPWPIASRAQAEDGRVVRGLLQLRCPGRRPCRRRTRGRPPCHPAPTGVEGLHPERVGPLCEAAEIAEGADGSVGGSGPRRLHSNVSRRPVGREREGGGRARVGAGGAESTARGDGWYFGSELVDRPAEGAVMASPSGTSRRSRSQPRRCSPTGPSRCA